MAWVTWLLGGEPAAPRRVPPSPVPPLIAASVSGDDNAVRLLLSFPATEPNATDPRKLGLNTALHEACWRGNTECVRALLSDPRVDRNRGNRKGYTGLVLAAIRGNQATVNVLLSDSAVERLVPDAVALGTEDADVLTLKAIADCKAHQVLRFRGVVRGVCALRRLRLRAARTMLLRAAEEGDDDDTRQLGGGWLACLKAHSKPSAEKLPDKPALDPL